MKDNKWTNKKGIVLTIIGLVVISIISMVVILNENGKEAASIGIIGGADGPTAIFISSSASLEPVAITICGLILVVGIGIFIYKKIKK
ncbi:sodium ion-translocating decarboxylase subunit beta [Cellulosilyticum sp. WCF-2]|uniref:sodium ion-translocating decarboxylase subunit beta n=1 Tax=Cellulosilyticum sp. WCF-2 TaxID=2497860 RepID=UPI000F8D7DA6|nr:sodium ion-translocating decarboxylase subunit beta [Cellulosilyticum sp. WCF-2]QEH67354.1 sodium ion-translocating decarboxylase subunit beta [Cellulosilyticum sp. WCF-2]